MFASLYDRATDLDEAFLQQQASENSWPGPLVDPKPLYRSFCTQITSLSGNLVCACCACIFHAPSDVCDVDASYPRLGLLKVSPPNLVPYDFSCGIPHLDLQHVMLQKEGLSLLPTADTKVRLCHSCFSQLESYRLPELALANNRWVGEPPAQLETLTWLEERLIARGNISGIIMRLQRHSNDSYLGLKGHIVVSPQDTRPLLDILPLPPSRLPDMIRVVWTGRTPPTMDELGSQLAVRTQVVYDALQWLCLHNEDYATVTVDHSEFERWPPVFIVQELVECMGEISDNIMEEMARAGVAVDDTHEGTVGHGDEEITVSGVMDVNNVSQSENATTLRRLASLSEESTINVVPGC